MARGELYPKSVDPGFPVLPPTPTGWQRCTFGDVVEVVERPVQLNPAGIYRLLTAKRNRGGITLRGEMAGKDILTKSQFEARGGDFLISRRQIIHGACGVVPDQLSGAVVSNEYSTLRTRAGLTMEFLRHFSHTPYFQRTCFHSSHGVDVEKMIFKINEWLQREVDIPPLSEQQKIAAVLSSVDDAIEATQAVINQLQVVKKAMMAELLTRGLPGRHTRFKLTEIGEVPEGWGIRPLADLTTLITKGESPRWQGFDYQREGVLFVTSENVRDGVLDISEPKFIPSAFSAKLARSRLEAGDVLVNIVGASIGRAALWNEEHSEANVNQAVAVVRADANQLRPRLVLDALYSPRGQEYFGTTKVDNARPNVSLASLRAFPMIVPPMQEQQEIAACFDVLDARLKGEGDFVRQLQNAKGALSRALLTGEVRVKPDEAAP